MRTYFLKTDRIGFSKWTKEDTALASSLWGDEEVTHFLCASGKFKPDDIIKRLDLEIQNDTILGIQYWPVFDLATDDFVGCCGLRPYRDEDKIYEIGFHLKSDNWGKGYGSEAAKAVIEYAFHTLGANNLFAGHHPGNISSGRLLIKLGFHHIGEAYYAPTKLYHPSYLYHFTGN